MAGLSARAPAFHAEVDLLVIGSGAGGMTAALAARARGQDVLIVEKSGVYGGSTACSGGAIWVPDNPVLRRAGIRDSAADVRAYLASVVGDAVSPARLHAFQKHGPEAIAFLERTSEHLRFQFVADYPDYHPENPGGSLRGRSIEAMPIDVRKLGEDEAQLRPSRLPLPRGAWTTCGEARHLGQVTRTWAGIKATLQLLWRVILARVFGCRVTALGQALVVRLRLALRDAGVPLLLDTALERLIRDADGRVIGVEVRRAGRRERIRARAGVVLATGGFEHNLAMRSAYLAPVTEDFSLGAPDNTGDGIRAAQALGARVELMDDAWWMPVACLPDGRKHLLLSERAIPCSLIINGHGERFANETSPYVDFVHAQIAGERRTGKHVPCYLIFDATAKRRYPIAGVVPGLPFPAAWFRCGLVKKARSLPALAAQLGVPAQALVETMARFNASARAGSDPDFARGESAYDRYYGDPTLKNPVLAAIDRAPFYALEVLPGDLGTKGGLACDEHSRVLDAQGKVIAGLYATGNTSASVMGRQYAGAGATIGPAIVFGWIAAQTASRELAQARRPVKRAPAPLRVGARR